MSQPCLACDRPVAEARCAFCGVARLAGRYTVLRVLAENDHSRVYLAEDPSGLRVALKELLYARAPDAHALESFQRESDTLAQLSDPRIPRFLESFREGAGTELRLFLAQEFVDGVSLLDELRSKTFGTAELETIAQHVLAILRYLHGLSPRVLHRDVKPANLVRRHDGALFLVDFGTAREIKLQGTVHATMTGTLGYAPLEQLGGTVDATSDLYALGATLLHLLTRIPPDQLMGASFELEIPAGVPCPPKLRRFIGRLIARRPSDRVQSVAAAERELASPPRLLPSQRKRVLGGAAAAATVAAGLMFLPRPYPREAPAVAVAVAPVAPLPGPTPASPPPATRVETPLRARWRFRKEDRADRIKDETNRYELEIRGGFVAEPGPSGDSLQLGSSARLGAFIGSMSAGTVSFWLRRDRATGPRAHETSRVFSTPSFNLVLTAQDVLALSAAKESQNEAQSHPLKPAVFHQVVVTWTEGEAKLYVDGEIAGTAHGRTRFFPIERFELGPGRISVADLIVRPIPASHEEIAADASAVEQQPAKAQSKPRAGEVLYSEDFATGMADLETNDLLGEWASIGRDPDGREFFEMTGTGPAARQDLCARVDIDVLDTAILDYEWRIGAAASGPATASVGVQADGGKGPLPAVWSMQVSAGSNPLAWSLGRLDLTERVRQAHGTGLRRIRGICFTGTGNPFVAQFARVRVTRIAR